MWWVTCVLWSTMFLAVKVGVADVPPFTFASVRTLAGALLLTAIAAAQRRLRLRAASDLRVLALTGLLLLAANYAFLYWGAQFIPAGLMAILGAGAPVFGLLLAWAIGRERVTAAKTAGLAAGVAGVAVIFGEEATRGTASLDGCAAAVMASIAVAAGYVLLKDRAGHLHPTTALVWQTWAAAVPLLALALWRDGPPTRAAWTAEAQGAAVYAAVVGSVVAFWLNCWLLQRMDASALLFMGIAEAPIAAAMGAAVLGERLGGATLAGTLFILAGTALVAWSSRGAAEAPEVAP